MNEGELPEGGMRKAVIDSTPILLAKVEGRVHAMFDRCFHMGCPLSRGTLDGHIVTCPCHDWRYDVRTGVFVDAKEIMLPTYECKIEDGMIMIRLED